MVNCAPCAKDQNVAPVCPSASDDLSTWAAKAGARSSDWTMCFTVSCLVARRILYSAAPCPVQGGRYGSSISDIDKGIGVGLASASKFDPEPISKSILVTITAVFGFFTQHHAQAVANEQKTLCQSTGAYNQFADQIEAALKAGQITVQNAIGALEQAVSQISQIISSVAGKGTSGCNAGCGHLIALEALRQYNEAVYYPSLVSGVANGGIGTVALVGGGAFAAHAAGVF